jgi:hypothetical protein
VFYKKRRAGIKDIKKANPVPVRLFYESLRCTTAALRYASKDEARLK